MLTFDNFVSFNFLMFIPSIVNNIIKIEEQKPTKIELIEKTSKSAFITVSLLVKKSVIHSPIGVRKLIKIF